MPLSLRCLACLSVLLVACNAKKAPEPPRSTLAKSPKPAGPPPTWVDLFKKGSVALPSSLNGVTFASTPDELAAVDATLLKGKPVPFSEGTKATIKLVRHADSRTLRSVRIDFPTNAKRALSSRWGDPVEGQVDGQRPAFFWFDRATRVQGILEEVESGSQLTLWPYSSLTEALSPPNDANERVLSTWLGRSKTAHQARYPRRMKRRAKPGFVAWLPPLQYRTRPLSVRYDLKGDTISGFSFKISTIGNPGLVNRVEEIIAQTWKVQSTATDTGKRWEKAGVRISTEEEKPGRQRPRDPLIRVRVKVIPTP